MNRVLAGLVPDRDKEKRVIDARNRLRYGVFEQAARNFAVLGYVWNITPSSMRKAVHHECLIQDALHLTTFAGTVTERDEIESRLFHLQRQRYATKKGDTLSQSIGASTKDTHLAHLYLDARFTRDWLERSPLPSDMSGLYHTLQDRGAELGLWLPRDADRITDQMMGVILDKAKACDTLARVGQLWLSTLALLDKDELEQITAYTLLSVLISKANLSPLPPLSLGGCFSPKTLANRPSFEEKMVYVAGVMNRMGAQAQGRLMLCHHKVEEWSKKLSSQAYVAGHLQTALPWLCFRERIRSTDITHFTGCSRMQANRIIGHLVDRGVVQPIDNRRRNRVFRVLDNI